jgi:hypothetical protein
MGAIAAESGWCWLREPNPAVRGMTMTGSKTASESLCASTCVQRRRVYTKFNLQLSRSRPGFFSLVAQTLQIWKRCSLKVPVSRVKARSLQPYKLVQRSGRWQSNRRAEGGCSVADSKQEMVKASDLVFPGPLTNTIFIPSFSLSHDIKPSLIGTDHARGIHITSYHQGRHNVHFKSIVWMLINYL